MQPSSSRIRRQGFTLIELLVVIAIIAILAAILFPVFAQAKDAAKDTQALNNAKQLGLASIMYAGDFDDFFPLAVVGGPTFWDSWQGIAQPYMKNWGIDSHPKVPALPPDTNTPAWYYQSRMHWGMPLRAAAHSAYATQGYYTYTSGSMTGGIARRIDGIGGSGVLNAAAGTYAGNGTYLPIASLSQTQIQSVADMVMITEANGPDMSWGLLPNPGGGAGPMNYWLAWNGGFQVAPWGNLYFTYCGPHSRKRPALCNGANNGANVAPIPQNSCTGTLPWPDGMTTYVACDGHAIAVSWRGGITAFNTDPTGFTYLKRMWPN